MLIRVIRVKVWCLKWFIQGFPRPFKAIKGYPSLFKAFWKKIHFYEQPIPTNSDLLGLIPAPLPPGVPVATPCLRDFKTF